MSKFVNAWGLGLGIVVSLFGLVLAFTGQRLMPTGRRNAGSWNALVVMLGEEGAALVEGLCWLAAGVAFIWMALTTPSRAQEEEPETVIRPRRKRRRRRK